MYKYHNMERPVPEKIVVTIDSVLPALPAKDQMLKQPSKDAFDSKMAECDQKI